MPHKETTQDVERNVCVIHHGGADVVNHTDVVLYRCIIIVTFVFCLGISLACGCAEYTFLLDEVDMDDMVKQIAIDVVCSRDLLACISYYD